MDNLQDGPDYFEASEIAHRHAADGMDVQEWCMVYNDRMSLFFHRAVAIGLPLVLFGVSLALMDYWQTDGQMSYAAFKKLKADTVDVSVDLLD